MNHTNHSLHYIYLTLLNPLLTPSELNKLGVCPLGINQMSSPLEGFPFFYTKVDISYDGLAWSRCESSESTLDIPVTRVITYFYHFLLHQLFFH